MNKYQALALVIANSEYEFTDELECCLKDGVDIKREFESLNIHVVEAINKSRTELLRCIEEFLALAGAYETAIIYYTGHGVQIEGENYIVPIDCAPSNKKAILLASLVNINSMLADIERKDDRINIIILDACRSEQRLAKGWSYSPGLAEIIADSGSFVSFATAQGQSAISGKDEHTNSLFTKHLLKHISTPNLSVEAVLKKVRRDVEQESEGQQIPWESTSLKSEFYFNKMSDEEIDEQTYQTLRGNENGHSLTFLSAHFRLTITDVLRRYDYVRGNRLGGIIIRDRHDREVYMLKRILDMGFSLHNYRWTYNGTPVMMGDFLFDPNRLDHKPRDGEEINVVIGIKVEIANNGVIIGGQTNLPANMHLNFSLSGSNYKAQNHADIQYDGKFGNVDFSHKGKPLNHGSYRITVTSPISSVQPTDVKRIIGDYGCNLQGEIVHDDLVHGKSIEFVEEFGIT